MKPNRSGFTFTELMMVIGIITVLSSLTFATLSIFRRSQMQATSQVTMSQLSRALTTYLDNYGDFGEAPDNADFIANPLDFLIHRREGLGLHALFTPGNRNWGRSDVAADQRTQALVHPLPGMTTTLFTTSPSSVDQATHVLDGFGNAILLTILRRPVAGSNWTRPSVIIISSTRGDAEDGEYIEYYYNDGDLIAWNERGYPNSDGTWDLYDAEKYITMEYVGSEDGGIGPGGGGGGGGGDEGGGGGGGKGKGKNK